MNRISKKFLIFFTFLSTFLLNSHLNSGSVFKKLSKFNQKNRKQVKQTFDNFFEVDAGNLYRSKQLDAKTLEYYIKKYGIKTIINLRGANPDRKWWQDEKRVAQELNVDHHDISMSAVRFSSREELQMLLDLYDNAPRPIYIHCQGGADRTGEAAAIWKIEKQGASNEEALEQLSIKYGHRKYANPKKDDLIKIWNGRDWLVKKYSG